MTKAPKFTMTNDTISIIVDGKARIVRKGAQNFELVRKALIDNDWDAAIGGLNVSLSIFSWAKGAIKVDNGVVSISGENVPSELNERIMSMARAGENPTPVIRFWERLKKNPSWRSVQQLWSFLQKANIPLTKDGCFLAYKSVRSDLLDHHSGTIDNTPGKVIEMERNKISDDPNEACHYGLHVGALNYVKSFGDSDRKIVICEVDPADVVCVPYDSNSEKMRVCRYVVKGFYNDIEMPSTTVDDEYVSGGDVDAGDEANFDRYDAMTLNELLLNVTLKELQRYASKRLKVVGAYKTIGGKVALIRLIKKARK